MKIRSGFVSNSSSSSFIVFSDTKLDTYESIFEAIGKQYAEYDYYLDHLQEYKAQYLSRNNNLEYLGTFDEYMKLVESTPDPEVSWDYNEPKVLRSIDRTSIKFDNPKIKELEKEWVRLRNEYYSSRKDNWSLMGHVNKEITKLMFEELKSKFGGSNKLVYYAHLEDSGGGINAELEHGPTFENLLYISESHH